MGAAFKARYRRNKETLEWYDALAMAVAIIALVFTFGVRIVKAYLVEEETTGNWNVYIDNNGVQTGNITVQNYVYTGYELPSTGGMGTAPFGVLGGALAAAAALLLVRKRKQNEEE